MKYFTKELWSGWNSEDDVHRQTTEQYYRNSDEYRLQLKTVLPRLAEPDRGFFDKESLHDGRLIAFITGDKIDFDIDADEMYDVNSHETSVRMKVMGPNLDTLFTLQYSGVKRVVFDYPTDDPLFHVEGYHIGDWGYDELTIYDDTYLRHEVLFASGTSILIDFKEFSHHRQPLLVTKKA